MFSSRENKTLLKYTLYGLGAAASSFFLGLYINYSKLYPKYSHLIGFGLYYLVNKSSLDEYDHENIREIPIDILRKIVKKIKHCVVYNLIIMLDKIKEYDKNEEFNDFIVDPELQNYLPQPEEENKQNEEKESQEKFASEAEATNQIIQKIANHNEEDDFIKQEMRVLYSNRMYILNFKLIF